MFYCTCSEINPLNQFSRLPPAAPRFPAKVQELLDQQQNLPAGSVPLELCEPELWLSLHTEPCCLPGSAVWPGGKRALFTCADAGSGRFSQAICSSPGVFLTASVPWSLMITLFFSPPLSDRVIRSGRTHPIIWTFPCWTTLLRSWNPRGNSCVLSAAKPHHTYWVV